MRLKTIWKFPHWRTRFKLLLYECLPFLRPKPKPPTFGEAIGMAIKDRLDEEAFRRKVLPPELS